MFIALICATEPEGGEWEGCDDERRFLFFFFELQHVPKMIGAKSVQEERNWGTLPQFRFFYN